MLTNAVPSPSILSHVGLVTQHSAVVHVPVAQIMDSGDSIKWSVPSTQSELLHVGLASQHSATEHVVVAHTMLAGELFK